MRRHEDAGLPPEQAAALTAIDATLDGEPVDPGYAEFAELALILRDERPVPRGEFATGLDERVARRFARPARPVRPHRERTWGRWLRPAGGLATALALAAVVVVLAGHGGGASSNSESSAGVAASAAPPARGSAGRRAIGSEASRIHAPAKVPAAAATGSSAAAESSSPAGSVAGSPAPTPAPAGKRQIVQSAQLALTTLPDRIDAVAQEVFDVVGSENGIVQSSSVTSTGTPGGSANFQLSVPSASLAQTLSSLSSLHGATVVSRSDATTDITGQVGGAGQRLAEARALRRSLLKQLAAATTTDQITALKARLRAADAAIARDRSRLRGLKRQVAYSRIAVSIQAVAPPAAHGSAFTIGGAAHDAGRVLVVVAGVALIALAVLVPLGLLAALAAWAGLAVRRRRREHALDLV